MKYRLRAGAVTHVGRVRTANQDAIVAKRTFAAVADGMGGHAGGEIASAIALSTFADELRDADIDTMLNAVRAANQAIFTRAAAEPQLMGMGTTLCGIAMVEIGGFERIAIVNVGDSRVYMLANDRLTQVTKDHSYVEELVEAGQITVEEARTHPRRNIVTRALGIDPNVEVDSWEVSPFPGDRYLLCSDGLFNEVSGDVITQVLVGVEDPKDAAEVLVHLANEGGGRDNISVIVADIIEVDDDAADDDNDEGVFITSMPPVGADLPTAMMPATAPVEALNDPEITVAQTVAAPVVGGWLTEADAPPVSNTPLPPPMRAPDVETVDVQSVSLPPRRSSWRTGVFVGALVGVVMVIGASIWYYARASYYVSFDTAGSVAVYQGRPQGLLWFDPTLVQSYVLKKSDIFDQKIVKDLEAGRQYGSKASAETYAKTLNDRLTAPAPTTTTITTTTTTSTTTTTTSTTVAPTTTTPPTTAAPATAPPPPPTEPPPPAPTSAA